MALQDKRLSCFLFLLCIVIGGCSHKDLMQSFTESYYQGDLPKAYKIAKDKSQSKDALLWSMQAGIVGLQLNEKDSFELLDKSEQLFSQYEAQGLFSGLFADTAAILVNENAKTYRGNMYEGVLLNYYKALLSMQKGNLALARVEFNRANDRQRRAKDYFSKDIQKAMQAQQQENAKDSNFNQIDYSSTNQGLDSYLQQNYTNIDKFKAYRNFLNPAVSYASGLFFMLESDNAKALDLYKQAYGMSNAQIINQDIAILQERQNRIFKPHTWLIIEEGQSPIKEEIALNFPAYLLNDRILHIGLALPFLKDAKSFYTNLHVTKDSQHISETSLIADFEGVIANEFNQQLPFIHARAVSSAIIKAIIQSNLSDQLDVYGALIGLLYSSATTNADVRTTSVLPYKVYVAQLENTQGIYELKNSKQTLLSFEISQECEKQGLVLCEKNDNIVYLRLRQGSFSAQILYTKQNK
ncbi:hypothetical protein CCY97_04380 [Helicobacter sp. 10-6591]|nr:hypothetical protein CCY97_04380 [Helicobacter sp. 10-6591]